MSDNELLRECYDQLRLLFNPEVPLVKALRERLEQPEHYIPLTDAEIGAIPVYSWGTTLELVRAIEARIKEKNA